MENWTFSSLVYERPDVDALRADLTRLTAAVKDASSAEDVFRVIAELDEITGRFYTMLTVMHIRHTLDTRDEFYEKENEYFTQVLPTVAPLSVGLSAAIAESPFRDEIEARFGRQYFVQIDLQKRSFCEANIPLMQRESLLTDEYQKIMASCQIEFDGKTLNLYGIQKYFEADDRAVRAAAWKAYSDFYAGHEERLEQIWDELIAIRNEMGRNLGFENFLPLGYLRQGRTDYGADEVAAFREQVRTELVPLCQKLYDAQARRLGVERICAWDEKRVFPDGNAVPAGDDDFMVETARQMYHELSPETGEFIDFMIGHGLMDLKNKPGKASTGYMTDLPQYKAPFVFSCFNQTIFDMQVLTHELGHAFAGYMAMRSQPISDYYSETTDIAEIHSMAMEQFAYPYAERFFGGMADKFRFAHLQEAITFVPFGVAVDEFQHICYAHPELSPKERTWEWHKLEEKYMPWRRYDPQDEFMGRGGYWYHKLHIYLYPFYYINYTLTTMGALEFKRKMAEDPEKAWADYLELCRVGGSMSYLETLRHAHLSVPFEPGAVARSAGYARDILLKEIDRLEGR
ncbi:MAG: M3 family oligoendopeptidase [Oscillospiraceae bacterium]|nr:M3 family oligoendopeptidase [Oscillospiraceae bacterium]